MKHFSDASFASLRSAFSRLADSAAAHSAPGVSPIRSELDELRRSLEPIIDGYRHSAIGITGVFGSDKCQSIASLFAQSVVEREHLTTTIARVTREDVVPVGGGDGPRAGACPERPLRQRSLNIWPSPRVVPGVHHETDPLELLHWLRAQSEFSIVTFDSLGDVITRLALAKRLDGIVVVNSGRRFDLELMASAIEMLERRGVRILGQVRSIAERNAKTAEPV